MGIRRRPRAERRALTNVGGPSIVAGDPAASAKLAAACDVPSAIASEEAARAHVHGFHSYPARLHPLVAKRLIEAFSKPGDVVLDPFAGSGTVLVEARLAGRAAIGVDANPLAVRLAALKVDGASENDRARWVLSANEVAAIADARRKAKAGPTKRYGYEDVGLFAPHVLLELDGLRAGIDTIREGKTKDTLELVLSAILTKVGRRGSDTSEAGVEKRIAAGYPARLFVKKTEELTARVAEVAGALAASKPAKVLLGDARVLAGVDDASVSLVVTSPPYPGNYDYLAHHAARLRWLRMPADRFDASEIGARRRLDPLGAAGGRARFAAELGDALRAMRRVMREDGVAIIVIADSVVGGAPVYAIDLIRSLAPKRGLALVASASQARPHFHPQTAQAFAKRERAEHAILLKTLP